jgi:hypothetical protein
MPRGVVIFFSYILACFCAAITLVLQIQFTFGAPGLYAQPYWFERLASGSLVALLGGLFLAAIPALFFIVIAEIYKKRSLSYFLLGGALATYIPLVTVIATASSQNRYQMAITLALQFLIAGIAGGAIYWAIAGRTSGGSA